MEKILFSAGWCQPCKLLKAYSKENNIKFSMVYDIDTDEGAKEAHAAGVRGVPTVIIMDDGGEVERIVGIDFNKLNKYK